MTKQIFGRPFFLHPFMNLFKYPVPILNFGALLLVFFAGQTASSAEPEYNLYRGKETREGRHSLSQDGHNPGLTNLLWWDPVLLGGQKFFLIEVIPSAGVPVNGTNVWTSSLKATEKAISYVPIINGDPAYFFAKTVTLISFPVDVKS